MSEASGWGPPGAEKNLDLPDQDDEGYDDKSEDSKTMRLTLMEEVLLLGIKDREVSTYSAQELFRNIVRNFERRNIC